MTLKELIESMPGYVDATNPTDSAVLAWLNETVPVNRTSVSGDELFQATDSTDWAGLSDAQKSQWLALCGRDNLDPFGAANVALVTNIFGGGSDTVTALQALRVEQKDRVTAAGISRRLLGESLIGSVRAQ